MKKITIALVFLLALTKLYGQDYISLSFSSTGGELDSVYVENTVQQSSLTLLGSETLHLVLIPSGILAEQFQENEIIIYPNPSDGFCNISFFQNESAETRFEIYNIAGQQLYSKTENINQGMNSFLLKGLAAGSYLIKIESKNLSLSKKFIINNASQGQITLSQNSNDIPNNKESFLQSTKATKSIVEMDYNLGEELLLIGYSHGFVELTLQIAPTEDQIVVFEFDEECIPAAPTTDTHLTGQHQIEWNWNTVSDATGYKYNTENNYDNAIDNGPNTSFLQTGLACGETFNLYVWAYNTCGNSAVLNLSESLSASPNAPTVGSQIASHHQISWNWATSSGAIGYKYNSTNDYSTASDIGDNNFLVQTNLLCETAYTLFVWAYNACGESNPVELNANTTDCSNSCGLPFVDARDDNSYNTLQLGNQCWMTENLKYLPSVVPPNNASLTLPLYYVMEYYGTNVSEAKESENYGIYGALYNYTAATSACPNGWHLPSENEWQVLEVFLGMSPSEAAINPIEWGAGVFRGTNEGSKLASDADRWLDGQLEINPNFGTSCFNSLPGGFREASDSMFFNKSMDCFFWTSTNWEFETYLIRVINFDSSQISKNAFNIRSGLSIRCIRD
jgi:uncharacterized protein (TIGR02145 family)